MISPVKRLAVTALIALYTVMLMWSTLDRTTTWAARQSEAISKPVLDDGIAIGKPRPVSPPRQGHRRIIENPFVVEPPVLASWIVLTPQPLFQTETLRVTGPDARRLSGRAPPRLI